MRNVAGLDSARQGVGSLDVIRPDRSGEAIDRAVGHPDDIVLGFERDHRQHRPEDLLLRQPHVGPYTAEDSWLHEVAAASASVVTRRPPDSSSAPSSCAISQ